MISMLVALKTITNPRLSRPLMPPITSTPSSSAVAEGEGMKLGSVGKWPSGISTLTTSPVCHQIYSPKKKDFLQTFGDIFLAKRKSNQFEIHIFCELDLFHDKNILKTFMLTYFNNFYVCLPKILSFHHTCF